LRVPPYGCLVPRDSAVGVREAMAGPSILRNVVDSNAPCDNVSGRATPTGMRKSQDESQRSTSGVRACRTPSRQWAWLALLAMLVRLPFAPGYMAGPGGIAFCPSGLTPAELTVLIPTAAMDHAGHAGHGTSHGDSGHAHEHRSGDQCPLAAQSFSADTWTLDLPAALPQEILETPPTPGSPCIASLWAFQARGPPARLA
jgi:hypothetical protein